jgi:hypothetical protein
VDLGVVLGQMSGHPRTVEEPAQVSSQQAQRLIEFGLPADSQA